MILTINGEEYPFRLELGATRLFAMKTGKKKIKTRDLGEMMKDIELIDEYPVLIWAGLKAGGGFKHSVEEVTKWLENDPAAFDRAMDLINGKDEVEEGSGKDKAKGTP